MRARTSWNKEQPTTMHNNPQRSTMTYSNKKNLQRSTVTQNNLKKVYSQPQCPTTIKKNKQQSTIISNNPQRHPKNPQQPTTAQVIKTIQSDLQQSKPERKEVFSLV